MNPEVEEDDENNVHLLAALGEFGDKPFMPVRISSKYDGYSWAKLPTVDAVEVATGKELQCDSIGNGTIAATDNITIKVFTSDGKTFSSVVCMAVLNYDNVFVTEKARNLLGSSEVWHHLGGYYEDGDTYDSQGYDFEKQWDRFWADFDGPDEHLRQKIMGTLWALKDWGKIQITKDGNIYIENENGTARAIEPPSKTAA